MDKTTKEKILELYRKGYPTSEIAEIVDKAEYEVVIVLEDCGRMRAR